MPDPTAAPPQVPPGPPRRAGRARRRIRPGRAAFFMIVIVALTLGAAEMIARGFWTIKGLGFWNCQRHIQEIYYPNLKDYHPMLRPLGAPKKTIEILILGGSTVNPILGPIAVEMLERLTRDLKVRVNITNLALPAHTSLDSYYRYLDLADCSFDLVLVYDSINELRANNCPPWMFHTNYNHYQWYREVNAIEDGFDRRVLALPITLEIAAIRAAQRLGVVRLIPDDTSANWAWFPYGAEIKTGAPLRNNLRGIVDLAARRGEKAMLMSFAYYLPADYTREKFDNIQLDYISHWFPAEVWGDPKNVVKGLETHNRKIRELAAQLGDKILFVDQAALIPRQGRCFNDICHLSTEGCARFVDNAIPAMEAYLKQLPQVREAAGKAR